MRALRRSWLAVAVIAIGSGAAAAVATAHHRLFTEVLPYVEPDRIVTVPGALLTYTQGTPSLDRWVEDSSEFAALGLYQAGPVTMSTDAGPRRVAAAAVGLDFFGVFGEAPIWGRTFDRTDRPGVRHAVVSHDIGRHLLGTRPSSPPAIRIDGLSFVVVGVMPEGFDFPSGAQVWVPFQAGTQVTQSRGRTSVIARLAPGVSIDDVGRRIGDGTSALHTSRPDFEAARTLRDELSRGVLPLLRVLMFFCVLLLLVTCVNVWGLGLVAATTARHEMAIRMAMGATRLQLFGAIVRHAGALAVCAAALGVAGALSAWRAFAAVAARLAPNLDLEIIDWRLPAYALAAALAATAGLTAGQAIPILRLDSRTATLAATARRKGASRTRLVLIAAQIAAAFILSSAGIASTEAVRRASRVHPGFGNADAVSVDLPVPHARFDGGDDLVRLAADVEARIRVRFGTVSVGLTDTTTGENGLLYEPLSFEGARQDSGGIAGARAIPVSVSSGYFDATGIPVLAGRLLGPADGAAGRPDVVISAAAAQRLGVTPAEAIGRSITHFNTVSTIVGVVGDVRMLGPHREALPAVYRPLGHQPRVFVLSVVVSGPGVTIPGVLEALHDVDPDLATSNPRIIGRYMEPFLEIPRVVQQLTSAAAVIAVVLAAIAIHGLLSYDVAARRRDIAVRLALGERRQSITRRYVAVAAGIASSGIAAGLLLHRLVWSLAGSASREVPPPTPLSLVIAALVVVVAALCASSRPASTAAATDPVTLLRE